VNEQVMTVKDAREIPKGPLRFGDKNQIECAHLIQLADLIADQRLECPECDGEGEIELAGEGECFDCPECKGAGEVMFSSEDIDAMDADEIALFEKFREKVGRFA
jgi:RecJ-like exonuclease